MSHSTPSPTRVRMVVVALLVAAAVYAELGEVLGPRSAACQEAHSGEVPGEAEGAEYYNANRAELACQDNNTAALREIGKAGYWSTCEELVVTGRQSVAKELAKHVAGPDAPALRTYVENRTPGPSDPALRASIWRVNRALLAEDWSRALEISPVVRDSQDTVLTVRVRRARGVALDELRRDIEATEVYARTGDGAMRLGWREQAMNCAARLERLGRRFWVAHNPAAALGCFDAAHPLRQWLGDPLDLARCESDVGAAATLVGDYARALEFGERAILALEPTQEIRAVTTAKENLGNLYRVLGGLPRAEELLLEALQLQRQELPQDVPGTLSDLGALYRCSGRVKQAIDVLEEARRLLGDSTVNDVDIKLLNNLGTAYRDAQRPDDATRCLESALEQATARGVKIAECKALSNLASIRSSVRDFKSAIDLDRRALAVAEEFVFQDDEQAALTSLARDLYGVGDYEGAIANAQRALTLQERLSGRLPLEIAGATRESRGDAISIGFDASAAKKDVEKMVWFLEHGRAQVLLAGLGAGAIDPAARSPEPLLQAEVEAGDSVSKSRSAYLAALKAGTAQEAAAAKQVLAACSARLREAQERVYQSRSKLTPAVYPEAVSLRDLQTDLRIDDLIVMYAITGVGTSAIVINRGMATVKGPWPTADVETATRPLRPGGDGAWGKETQLAARRAVIDVLDLPAGTGRVIVIPDGFLAYVPFPALLPDRDVVLSPSVSVYRALVEASSGRGEGVLAVGDPVYPPTVDPALAALHPSLRSLARLPASRKEVMSVGTKQLLGADATVSALMSVSRTRDRWRAVHLACHAVVDPERPQLSYLALTPAPSSSGVVTVRDVAALRLQAELITLSACESGVGRLTRVEGIVGFTRAFLLGGARDVLVSTWKVDSDAAAAFMVSFYKEWGIHGSRARALREAQAHVRSDTRWTEPRYWAAWQLWGCGR